MSDRRRSTVNAVVALLQAMPEAWLQDVLQRLQARGAVVLDNAPAGPPRVCGICTLTYPLHMARWADDHEWEEPAVREKGPAD